MKINKRSLQEERKSTSQKLISILSIFSLTGVAFFSHPFLWKSYSQHQLAQAQNTWKTQGVLHYRLQLHYSAPFNCQQEVEIKDEKVIAVGKNTCTAISPVTVSELFQELASIAEGNKCGPNGCSCDGNLSFKATYDSRFGYPHQLEISLDRQQRWLNFNFLDDKSGRYCTLIGFIGKKISISGFTPIQS